MVMVEEIITRSGVVLLVEKRIIDDGVEVCLRMERHEKCVLHWGVRHHPQAPWRMPPQSVWPEGSRAFDQVAVQTPFLGQDGATQVIFRLEHAPDFSVIAFSLFFPEENRWDNNHGKNYYIDLQKPKEKFPEAPRVSGLADKIIEKEMSGNSWTLMHRFNLCYDLLDKVRDDVEGLALIFVWLRFSAIRQLDWQRNYNTKPRELSHAMDRLTLKLADRYTNEPQEQVFIRLILTTMGRGGEGQRIRDEVLNIMHRHHIKEVSGHFLEEWHQKLHNNTTPDDVVICEAYLKFLRSNGNLNLFYKRLQQDGVTKKRLQSYERPIKSRPDFIPHLKEALIPDFEHFLEILKAVHSGTDLGTAIHAARYLFYEEMNGLMDFIWRHRDVRKIAVCSLVEKITKARRLLAGRFREDPDKVRDLLYLDLALEDFLRVVVERNLHLKQTRDQQVELIAMVLQNLCLSNTDDELAHCLRHWERLSKAPRFGKEWSLQAKAVLDRLGHALGAFIDQYYKLLQPKAEFLGRAFHADTWTITLFGEEVVRGQPAFVLSILLRHLDPILRKRAELGNWQVISPGRGMGQVEVVATLKSVQGKGFARPTIIVSDEVAGDEEIPEGVTGVITQDVTDIVSHVAIRARNAHVLFATCYNPEIIGQLKSLSGHSLKLSVNASGEVVFEEGPAEIIETSPRITPVPAPTSRPGFTAYAVSVGDFNEKNLGGKSNNLRRLQGKLPEWVGLPTSVALPFGVFERVLAEENNKEIAKRYEELIRCMDEKTKKVSREVLGECRKTILALKAPDELVSSLHKVMEETGLARPANWDDARMCIKRVWSSKWNERAYLSRIARGISHKDLFMAVLIQEVVEADYSFVIHTVNPFTGEKDEIYAEVVLGLGETLVGNYPGRALSFSCRKGDSEPQVLAFPSKSAGLFGSGVIFRSDSNGEDLAGYAGAGLYDSVMLPSPREISLDYTRERLVWDEDFRRNLLVGIATIGIVLEETLGSPQDIEGAYSKGRYYVVQTRPQVGIANE
jgi:alpha-glucan,water dikinase